MSLIEAVLLSLAPFVLAGLWAWWDGRGASKNDTVDQPCRRCQVCGGRMQLELSGAWVHVGDAHLVARAMPHIAEPLTSVEPSIVVPLLCTGCGWTIGTNRGGVVSTRDHECVGRWVS